MPLLVLFLFIFYSLLYFPFPLTFLEPIHKFTILDPTKLLFVLLYITIIETEPLEKYIY
jgi:hypothetical protein